MSRRIYGCVGIVLLVATVSASAQEKKISSRIVVDGVGTLSCGQYLEFRRTNNDEMTARLQQWAAGYFAGYSAAITKPGMSTNLGAPDLETYTAWVDKWCADDPTSNVYAGVTSLRIKLQSKQ